MLNTAFYQHPVILNRQEHAAHKLNKIENYQNIDSRISVYTTYVCRIDADQEAAQRSRT